MLTSLALMAVSALLLYDCKNEDEKKNNFWTQNSIPYKKFGTYNLACPKDGTVTIFVDDLLFMRTKGPGGTGLYVVEIHNLPIGGEIRFEHTPSCGKTTVDAEFILKENMCRTVYNSMKNF